MNESEFISENHKEWKALEQILKWKIKDPKKLSDTFQKVSNDLAYAQTYFPRRSVTLYLNDLVSRLFDAMKTRRKYDFVHSITNYFGNILPSEIIRNRKAFLLSLFVFLLATIIGIYSTIQEPDFPRYILGDEYVSMTNDNVEAGDPMAVYKSGTRWDSFIGITINNILVSFYAFVFGIFGTIGTYFVLIKNGIMLGAFQTMFYQKDILAESMLTIWIHGTIEISSIVVAGAAGITLGKSILFPGSYSRMDSLKTGATKAMYILISTLPLFIIAGCFEGSVTPQTDLSNSFKLTIILTSAALILIMYVVYPLIYYRSGKYQELGILENKQAPFLATKTELAPDKFSLKFACQEFGTSLATTTTRVVLPISIFLIIYSYFFLKWSVNDDLTPDLLPNLLSWSMGKEIMLLAVAVATMYFFICMYCLESGRKITYSAVVKTLRKHFLPLIIISICCVIPLYFINFYLAYLFIFIVPPAVGIYTIKHLATYDDGLSALAHGFKQGYLSWASFAVNSLIIVLIYFLARLTYNAIFNFIILDILSWHQFFDNGKINRAFIDTIGSILFWSMFLPFLYRIYSSKADFLENTLSSIDLKKAIGTFGKKKYSNG